MRSAIEMDKYNTIQIKSYSYSTLYSISAFEVYLFVLTCALKYSYNKNTDVAEKIFVISNF